MTDKKDSKPFLGEIKVKTVYGDELAGKFIHRSLDVKNKFSDTFRNAFQEEKDSIIDKREEVFVKSIKSLDKKQKIDLLLAWAGVDIYSEAKLSVPFDEKDEGFAEALEKAKESIKKRKEDELNSLSEDDIDSKLKEDGKTQIALAPALEKAYKSLVFDTFRTSKDLRERVFKSPEDVGETLTAEEFNRLIGLRTEFEMYSVGDEELKKK